MKIDAAREGGSTVLRLGGRLDREWAEHLSTTLEELLQEGVRSVTLDLSGVTYVSSAATKVLTRWQQELAVLRGEVLLTSVPEAVRETFAIIGWDWSLEGPGRSVAGLPELRESSWQSGAGSATSGQFQMSSSVSAGTLTCRLHGHPDQLTRARLEKEDCSIMDFPRAVFGLGLGAIGGSYEECQERLGELVAVEGCIAYFPSDGARMADYLVGNESAAPRAVLASGLTCEGGFS